MAAKIEDRGFQMIVKAAPGGEYGFGTVGMANPDQMISDAWRMVQRAGLTRIVERDSAQIVSADMGTRAWVEYDLRADADISAIPDRLRGVSAR